MWKLKWVHMGQPTAIDITPVDGVCLTCATILARYTMQSITSPDHVRLVRVQKEGGEEIESYEL